MFARLNFGAMVEGNLRVLLLCLLLLELRLDQNLECGSLFFLPELKLTEELKYI